MMSPAERKLTLREFLSLAEIEGDIVYELVNGQAIPKMSPRFFHSSLTLALIGALGLSCQSWGRIRAEWAVTLIRKGEDWVPVPDLLYVSHQRLPADWVQDEPCPAIPELVIEIVALGQSFGALLSKVRDYLDAGVLRIWVVDSYSHSITVFYPDAPPQTYVNDIPLVDPSLSWLSVTAEQIFQQAGIPKQSSNQYINSTGNYRDT